MEYRVLIQRHEASLLSLPSLELSSKASICPLPILCTVMSAVEEFLSSGSTLKSLQFSSAGVAQ